MSLSYNLIIIALKMEVVGAKNKGEEGKKREPVSAQEPQGWGFLEQLSGTDAQEGKKST